MRITSQGPGHHPAGHPERFGLLPHTEVEFVVEGDVVVLRKAGTGNSQRPRLDHAGTAAAPTPGMTTDEIMRLTRGED